MKMIDIHTILKKKTELLCKGVYLSEEFLEVYRSRGIDINFGRKGGAGPLGGRYFFLEDGETLVNVALWNDKKKSNLTLKDWSDGYFEVYDEREKGFFCKMELIPEPKFYNKLTSDGIEMKKIALVHGYDCLSSTIYQKCKYWACGEACKFCGIELSLAYGTTILEKNYKQMNEVIAAAMEEGRCNHMTLTSGTTEESDKGAKRYIELLKGIRKEYPDLPLHIQIEPIDDLSYLEKLKDAGADTIGIHIEILDEFLREIITPGKAKIPNDQFKKSWERAIDIFGKNQVETYILTGFGESPNDFIDSLEEVVSIGVIPYITPVRAIPGVKSTIPIMNHNTLLEIYSLAAKMMKKYNVNPLEHKAGCVKCGGCSAINEAYKAQLN
ncbi:MAG: radical SAM protein [Promethearchaeota archaeon]